MSLTDVRKIAAEIDASTKRYIQIRSRYADISRKLGGRFAQRYDNEIKNLDDLYVKVDQIAQSLFDEAIASAMKDLVAAKIFEISQSELVEKFNEKCTVWTSALQVVKANYEVILEADVSYKNRKEQERVASSGGGVIGGGFGLEGAAKGVAIATAANLAIVGVQGVFSGIGSLLHSSSIKDKKNSVFSKPELKASLIDAMEQTILPLHLIVIGLICEAKGSSTLFNLQSEIDIKKANAIIENIESGRVESEEVSTLLSKALTLNPYLERAYVMWLDKFGDLDGVLSEVAGVYGVEQVVDHKIALINRYGAGLSLATEESCIDAIALLNAKLACLGIREDNLSPKRLLVAIESQNSEINRRLSELRSLNGVLYDSVAAKDQAKRDLDELAKEAGLRTHEGVVYSTVAERDDAIERQLDEKRRTFKGVVYPSIEARRQEESRDTWRKGLFTVALVLVGVFGSLYLYEQQKIRDEQQRILDMIVGIRTAESELSIFKGALRVRFLDNPNSGPLGSDEIKQIMSQAYANDGSGLGRVEMYADKGYLEVTSHYNGGKLHAISRDGGEVWVCGSSGIEAKYLPKHCAPNFRVERPVIESEQSVTDQRTVSTP